MSRAFTLIELLVAVAILAVVSAVLFPTLARAGQATPISTPLSRFGRVAKGVLMYAADNDDRTPPYYGTSTPTMRNPFHNSDTWVGRVFPYVRERSAFFDPTVAEPKAMLHDSGGDLYADAQYGSKAPTDPYTYSWEWVTTIALNSDGFAAGGSGSCLSSIRFREPRSVAAMDQPQARLMLAPSQLGGNLYGWDYFRAYEASWPDPKKTLAKGFSWNEMVWNARSRWSGRLGAAYADGHVGRFGQEMFVPYPAVGGHAQYCAYLESHPKITRFWGKYWSMR